MPEKCHIFTLPVLAHFHAVADISSLLTLMVKGLRHGAPWFSAGGRALSRSTSSARTPPQSALAEPLGNRSPRAGHAVAHSVACTCYRGSRGRGARRTPAASRRRRWLRPWRRESAGD